MVVNLEQEEETILNGNESYKKAGDVERAENGYGKNPK